MNRRKRLGFSVACTECGAVAGAFQKGDGYWSHCLNCGSIWFWKNPAITDRVAHGHPVCIHNPPVQEVRRGYMRNCAICRVRMFKPPLLEAAKGLLHGQP